MGSCFYTTWCQITFVRRQGGENPCDIAENTTWVQIRWIWHYQWYKQLYFTVVAACDRKKFQNNKILPSKPTWCMDARWWMASKQPAECPLQGQKGHRGQAGHMLHIAGSDSLPAAVHVTMRWRTCCGPRNVHDFNFSTLCRCCYSITPSPFSTDFFVRKQRLTCFFSQ